MPRSNRRRSLQWGCSRPFDPAEDALVADMIGCGLDSYFWTMAMPHRRFGEIAERAYQLAIPRAPLL